MEFEKDYPVLEKFRGEFAEGSHRIVEAADQHPLRLRASLALDQWEERVELTEHDGGGSGLIGDGGRLFVEMVYREQIIDLVNQGRLAVVHETANARRSMMRRADGGFTDCLNVKINSSRRFLRDTLRRETIETKKVSVSDKPYPEFTVSLTSLPENDVVAGDTWSVEGDVPHDAPPLVFLDPPNVKSQLVKRVLFDGRNAVLIHATAQQYWAVHENLDTSEPYFRTRDTIKYYLDVTAGRVLWYEFHSHIDYPEHIDTGTTIRRGHVS